MMIKKLGKLSKTANSDELKIWMRNPVILSSTKSMLNLLGIHSRTSTRIFLSAFMINWYGNEIFDPSIAKFKSHKELAGLVNQLSDITIQMLLIFESLKTINTYSKWEKEFRLNFAQYLKVFLEWKRYDKDAIIDSLIINYWQLETIKKESIHNFQSDEQDDGRNDGREIVINGINSQQETFLNHIKFLDPKHGMEKFYGFMPLLTNNFTDLEDIIRKAFWDSVKADLQGDDPKFIRILLLVEDAKEMIRNCIPSRTDLHCEIDQKLDFVFFKQMIDNKAMDLTEVSRIIVNLCYFIKSIQCPSQDKELEKWRDDLLIELDSPEKLKLDDFFPNFFQELFRRLEKIKKDIEDFKQTSIYQEIYYRKNGIRKN